MSSTKYVIRRSDPAQIRPHFSRTATSLFANDQTDDQRSTNGCWSGGSWHAADTHAAMRPSLDTPTQSSSDYWGSPQGRSRRSRIRATRRATHEIGDVGGRILSGVLYKVTASIVREQLMYQHHATISHRKTIPRHAVGSALHRSVSASPRCHLRRRLPRLTFCAFTSRRLLPGGNRCRARPQRRYATHVGVSTKRSRCNGGLHRATVPDAFPLHIAPEPPLARRGERPRTVYTDVRTPSRGNCREP
jgi:hypothetical protein